eukprot:GGOE01049689.1.p1 GENE.GGOE01049689.1~~GGOE01049689.1.p1  ORF type:complete len:495 (+),score=116.66 GGOE01049689.1:39-1487(+)
MARASPSTSGDLSLAQLQSQLYSMLQVDGTSDDLRSRLRQRVLSSLRAKATGRPEPEAPGGPSNTLVHRAVNVLVLEHLRYSGLSVSCDVFASESDQGHGFGVAEALEVLRINPACDGEEGAPMPPVPVCADTPLLHVITTLSNLVAATRKRCLDVTSREVQCDLHASCSSLEEKLRYIDATLRRQREGQTVTVEQAMRQYRAELQGRMCEQMAVEKQHFRITELARMQREEAARYQQELRRKLAKLQETETQLQCREAGLCQRERALERAQLLLRRRGEVAEAATCDAAVQVEAAQLRSQESTDMDPQRAPGVAVVRGTSHAPPFDAASRAMRSATPDVCADHHHHRVEEAEGEAVAAASHCSDVHGVEPEGPFSAVQGLSATAGPRTTALICHGDRAGCGSTRMEDEPSQPRDVVLSTTRSPIAPPSPTDHAPALPGPEEDSSSGLYPFPTLLTCGSLDDMECDDPPPCEVVGDGSLEAF